MAACAHDHPADRGAARWCRGHELRRSAVQLGGGAMLAKIAQWWSTLSPADLIWLLVGLTGQAMFSARWIVQWLATERQRRSTVPQLFWYLSFAGGLLVFSYGLYRV